MTSFDDYSYWQEKYTFGIDTVAPDGLHSAKREETYLSEKNKESIKENITRNVTDIADRYPEVVFYVFYTPYSIAWWETEANEGKLYKYLEAEKYVAELIIPHERILSRI